MHEGKATVWRTRDAGSSWQPMRNGLPQVDAHLGVLRQGMTIDKHDTPGLYFGTSTGQIFASADEGDSVERDRELPPVDLLRRRRDRRLRSARWPTSACRGR